jgi:hypothetical protein
MKTIGLDEARAAKERARSLFAGKASVAGIGLTRVGDGYGVKVNLEAPPAPDADRPDSIDGVPVRIEVVGTIRPRRTSTGSIAHRDRSSANARSIRARPRSAW